MPVGTSRSDLLGAIAPTEALTDLAFYGGWPQSLSAVAVAREVLEG